MNVIWCLRSSDGTTMISHELTRAVRRQLTTFVRHLRLAEAGTPRGVHQARVASRRLRESLATLDDVLPTPLARRARRVLRKIGRALGPVRECDVTVKLLQRLADEHQWSTATVDAVGSDLARSRSAALQASLRARQAATWLKVAAHLRQALRTPVPEQSARVVATATRTRRRERGEALVESLHAVSSVYVPDQLHAVRIAAKKLRYTLEWEHDITGRAWDREHRALERSQDQFGDWHDLVVLQERLDRLRRTRDHRRATVAELTRMTADLERGCRAAHALILPRLSDLRRVATRARR
jgi:CHAD domain-containing protein